MVSMNISTVIQSTGMLNSVWKVQIYKSEGVDFQTKKSHINRQETGSYFCKSFSQTCLVNIFSFTNFSNCLPLQEKSALIQNGPTSPKLQHLSVLFQVESLYEAPTKWLVQPPVLASPSCLWSAELPAAFRQLHQLDSGEEGGWICQDSHRIL